MRIEFILNGSAVTVEAPADMTLLVLLRDVLNLTGTKEGCAVGECGACSVLLDGQLVNSCLVLAGEALLAANPNPGRAEIRRAIAGNLCRCTGYQQIVDAIQATAVRRQEAVHV